MKGQWRGRYEANTNGEIVVELDELERFYRGCAYLYGDDTSLPGTWAIIATTSKEPQGAFRSHLLPLNPQTQEPTSWDQVSAQYPGATFADYADVEYKATDTVLNLSWCTELGATGNATIARKDPSRPSELVPRADVVSWGDFKDFAINLEHGRYIFRGQAKPWRLRTSFHRTGRADLHRYSLKDDIPTLHRNLSARTRHFYDLKDPLQTGAFYNLIQHHGYPTPLMDWTLSPFVAAFFAFKGISPDEAARASDDLKVRIFIFDEQKWCADFSQIQNLVTRRAHFSVLKALAIGNERMVPQQALTTFTNVDDVEAYIQGLEAKHQQNYLEVIDLPISVRGRVMQELSLMGITAGSMFPGLDGACEELRERYFCS